MCNALAEVEWIGSRGLWRSHISNSAGVGEGGWTGGGRAGRRDSGDWCWRELSVWFGGVSFLSFIMELVRPMRSEERPKWTVYNPYGRFRVIVTKNLVEELWIDVLKRFDCRIEVCMDRGVLSKVELLEAIGARCDGVVGQLTETWDDEMFAALKSAGVSVGSVAMPLFCLLCFSSSSFILGWMVGD